jgi:hypothetical protein
MQDVMHDTITDGHVECYVRYNYISNHGVLQDVMYNIITYHHADCYAKCLINGSCRFL